VVEIERRRRTREEERKLANQFIQYAHFLKEKKCVFISATENVCVI